MKDNTIPSENRIFVNRTLNLNSIKLIGFDMDYTLATYDVPTFEEKAYRIVQNKLIKEYGYPEEIRNFKFDKDFIIRGLVIDTEAGNFLKVNRYGFVRIASHGTRFFTFEEQKKLFGTDGIDLTDPKYYIVHTLFSLAEGCLYAQLVDYFEEKQKPFSYRKLFIDVRKSLNDSHQEEELKGDIVKNPEKYLIQDKRIVDALLKFRKFGKKLALITNSDYTYSRKIMDYCFGPFLEEPWQNLFDLIVVAANKPNFFLQKQNFLKVDPETGLLSNFYGKIEWNGIYQGGNAAIIEKHLNLEPQEILYLGDHILGDVVTLKETIGWRTGLVVQELAEEVPILEKTQEIHNKIARLMAKKEKLEDKSLALREQIYLKLDKPKLPQIKKEYETIKNQLVALDDEIRDLIFASQEGFNKYWGEIMRAGNEISRFATLVERYACIYMAGIANLSYYSPFKYFRSKRRYLAHDPLPDYDK
ncbi:MAG: 5' nucleotidase [Candidatus Rifleibacteriota bacterium]